MYTWHLVFKWLKQISDARFHLRRVVDGIIVYEEFNDGDEITLLESLIMKNKESFMLMIENGDDMIVCERNDRQYCRTIRCNRD